VTTADDQSIDRAAADGTPVGTFEETLAAAERTVDGVLRTAAAVTRDLRRALAGARTGQIRDARKALAAAQATAIPAGVASHLTVRRCMTPNG